MMRRRGDARFANHAGRSGRTRSDAKRAGDFSKRRLLGIADLNPSAKPASSLRCGLGSLLTDLAQPTLEGHGVAGSFRAENSGHLAQLFNRFGLDFRWLATGEFSLEPVTRHGAAFAGRE